MNTTTLEYATPAPTLHPKRDVFIAVLTGLAGGVSMILSGYAFAVIWLMATFAGPIFLCLISRHRRVARSITFALTMMVAFFVFALVVISLFGDFSRSEQQLLIAIGVATLISTAIAAGIASLFSRPVTNLAKSLLRKLRIPSPRAT